MAAPPDTSPIRQSARVNEPLISVRDVTKSFVGPGGEPLPVLQGIDMEVADGEFVALLGRSGSGKSTLLRCIAGLIAPTSGEVCFRGHRLTGTNQGTAMVFQTFALLPWLTVRQNVEVGLEARQVPASERVKLALRAIDIVGLDGYESAFPKELSGGMRQRVGFARALVVEPDLLLMDEPFSALDVLTAENLRGELLELWEGHRFPTRSILMVTHNIEEAVLLADRIVILGSNPGRIRAELINQVPRPRHRRTPDFDQLVDRIYALMTGRAEEPDAVAPGVQSAARHGTPGDIPLPHATVDGLSGLAEILQHRDGAADLADLARLLGLEVDDMLPLVDALVLLGLAQLDADTLRLTTNGELFAGASIQESKRIFAAAAIERAPLVRTIDSALQGSKDGNLPSGFFTDILHRSFSREEAQEQLELAINWGRYAELYSFDQTRRQLIREEHGGHMVPEAEAPARRGALRIYLGAYPGAGKTFAMLRDGQHRREHGEDVVIAAVNTHGRPHTEEAIGSLERVPPRVVDKDRNAREEMDLEAVLARSPQVALVDDLAHINAPGLTHPERWQDVDDLRSAGVDVMTTLDVGQLESLKEAAERVTGVAVPGGVPDRFLDSADDVQFIDIAPTALRRRVSHGNVYPPERIEEVLAGPFRLEALGPMRELALRLVAQRLGGGAAARLEPQDVVVAVGAGVHAESLIRRGARLARRTGGRCTVVTVRHPGPELPIDPELSDVAQLATRLGATLVERRGDDLARVLSEFVREVAAEHLVIGESRPPDFLGRWRRTLTDRLVGSLPDIDLHVVARLHASAAGREHAGAARTEVPAAAGPDGEVWKSPRGALRVYLGYARGCGTTTAMLEEARRRKSRGTDVVVAVPQRGLARIEGVLGDLEVLGAANRGPIADQLDVEALLARNPQVACLDSLAQELGSSRTQLQDLERLMDAGITLIATLHLLDLRSTAEALQLDSQPGDAMLLDDSILSLASDIELIDIPPSVLLDRVRQGQVIDPTDVESALHGEFEEERLNRLREYAFRVVAWQTDHQQVARLREQGLNAQWEARPRIMACVAPRPGMERVIRRAAALAASLDTDFRAVTVRPGALGSEVEGLLQHYGALSRQVGGEFVALSGPDPAPALADYARENLVTEMLAVRGSRRTRRAGTTIRHLIRMVSDVDIHILADTAG